MAKQAIPRCPVCGTAFTQVVASKKYCSAKCRLIAWAQRQQLGQRCDGNK